MNLRVLIKRWYVIWICAILCSSGLYYEKSKIVPIIPQTGDIKYIRIVKFHEIPTETLKDTSVEIKMDALVKAWPNLSMLTSGIDDHLDMQKLNPKWGTMTQSQKFGWIEDHFHSNWIGPGMYELIFQMKKDEAKNAEYIKKNNDRIIEEYENYFRESAGMVTYNTSLTTVKNFELIDEVGMPTTQQIEKKYAVIGFVLGALVGVVIVMVWDARKRIAQK